MTYKLFTTYRSPYARKVRVALLEKNIPFEEFIEDLANKSENFRSYTVTSTIPTLVCPDGLALDDSTLILHYLEETHPTPLLLPQDKRLRYEAWLWEELADRVCDQNVNVFFEDQKTDKREAVFEKCTRITNEALKELGQLLTEREYIVGAYSIADIAFASTLGWMEFRLKFDLTSQPQSIQKWLKRIYSRPSFQKTLPKL